MFCVMCKYASGSIELVDTYPDLKTAEEECKLQQEYHKFLASAGLHTKPREYFVEKELPRRGRKKAYK